MTDRSDIWHIFCRACPHISSLRRADYPAERAAPDRSNLYRSLRCARCGASNPEIRVQPAWQPSLSNGRPTTKPAPD